jgi:putative ABC transport system ATP-binding protein
VIDGKDVTNTPEHKRAKYLGRVFQDPMMGTAADMEIQENLALAKRRGKRRGLGWGISKSEREEYRELLSTLGLGLEDRMNNFPAQLSGGEQQRVAIARAVAKNPQLLLCDEPTGALDYETGKQVLQILQDMSREHGSTVIIVTHNAALAPIGDQVLHIQPSTSFACLNRVLARKGSLQVLRY